MPHSTDSNRWILPSGVKTITVGVASGEAIGANDNRITLTLGPPDSGTITYTPIAPAVVGQGFNLAAGADPLTLIAKRHGWIVQSGWHAIGSGAGLGAMILEAEKPAES